jgi:hypothetical protein
MGNGKEVFDVGALGHFDATSHSTQQSQVSPTTLGARDVSSSQPKLHETTKSWELDIGPTVIGDEM